MSEEHLDRRHGSRSRRGVSGRGDGLPRVLLGIDPARPDRYNAEGIRHAYGAVITGAAPDHPINVDHLESCGVLEGGGLHRTIGELEAVTRRQGASFLDLSHLLPDRAFRDSGGHFTVDESWDGPKLVAEELVEFFSSTAARD